MASRQAVGVALVELRVQWKSIDDSPAMVAQMQRGVEGYDDDELRLAIERLCVTHRAGWPPRVADVVDACAAIAKVRRSPATRTQTAGEWYCWECKTRLLVHLPHPWDSSKPGRYVPDCRDDCPQRHAWWHCP